jgi:voltage-gated potassium channel
MARLGRPRLGRPRLGKRIAALFNVPLLSRLAFHLRRMTGGLQRGFFLRLFVALSSFVVVAAGLLTVLEGPRNDAGGMAAKFGDSFYWGVTTVLGNGDTAYVETPAGKFISWLLVLFGVAIVAAITGALVGFVIDILLKEGLGLGAAG